MIIKIDNTEYGGVKAYFETERTDVHSFEEIFTEIFSNEIITEKDVKEAEPILLSKGFKRVNVEDYFL